MYTSVSLSVSSVIRWSLRHAGGTLNEISAVRSAFKNKLLSSQRFYIYDGDCYTTREI